MNSIRNREIYLRRMAAPLQEKLKVIRFFPENPKTILDVGCADGTITREIAKMFPSSRVLGIDLDQDFIDRAIDNKNNPPNVEFRKVYLRELLAEPEKYDAVSFILVLHEFYSYGEGISSVLRAVADAHEILRPEGRIVIRDMILNESAKTATLGVKETLSKIQKKTRTYSFYRRSRKEFRTTE